MFGLFKFSLSSEWCLSVDSLSGSIDRDQKGKRPNSNTIDDKLETISIDHLVYLCDLSGDDLY